MHCRLFVFGAVVALAQSVQAQVICEVKGCPTQFDLTSISENRSYAVLIAAPDVGCRRVRFRVEAGDTEFLGHTPPLGPGDLAVVRVGRGFAAGEHILTIASEGCDTRPAATRRVTLAKLSPDHGWRASN
ncbi:MAG: hypothetical protein MUE52_09315 [Tabrizicola sp.]|jgi:hypothetical protein|nr:hypothetical protein [Tabrizicola sp.]